MDCICSFQQLSVISGGEGSNYSLLESLNSNLSFKCRSIGSKRLVLAGRSEKLKKLVTCCRNEVVSYLGCHMLPRSSGFSFTCGIESSSGVVKTCCQGEDSVVFINGNGNGRRVDYGASANGEGLTDGVDDS